MNKKISWIMLVSLLVILGVGMVGYFNYWLGPRGDGKVLVYIPAKSGTASIARQLQQAGVIHSSWLFRGVAVIAGKARRLQAGEYAFAPRTPLQNVINRIAAGQVETHPVTIPEGFTAQQIAAKLQAAGLIDNPAEFLALVQQPQRIKNWQVSAPSLEGYLFPDTYQFIKGMSGAQIAKQMIERFQSRVDPALLQAGQQNGLNENQLITLASIIEREVRLPQEKPLVASIFINRLQKQMRLESCATVLYSMNRVTGSLSLEDLQTSSPYNTYRHRGLPPGPISNPGLLSIQAAAQPAKTEYLFFVVRPDGSHVFSKDFEEHKRAKWQQRHARRQKQLTSSPAEIE